ncbi:MAG: D-serine ammonia-lyase [Pseudomonas sp. PGPPP1]|uniref:D-serine ammonia-lyase n=1 Tax=Pseudomonas sp. PGPPP1 TaxID=2015553 RepID=UPI000BDACE43|nr:D-serine ammonia-lyase [Pseudomonas sp. PGPPP1]OYU07304.1 MAG: D-serine ammonia-lyase [Pseudomonas sp. PGPPP1]
MKTKIPEKNNIDHELKQQIPLLWINPDRNVNGKPGDTWGDRNIGPKDIFHAADRFDRFKTVLKILFPELEKSKGNIESELIPTPTLQKSLGLRAEFGQLFVKTDHNLPIAGSIKARGGIHEILQFAEDIVLRHGLATPDNLEPVLSQSGKQLLSRYKVAVGSTGNLGLSIGVIASALGFQASVHMSADAKEWKKQRLRDRGVAVIEHEGDYAAAVEAGRKAAAADPFCHFVDDESSFSLFSGYSAAALGLRHQLSSHGISVGEEHPLFVYIPCGVGGAPGGVAFGLAHLFGPNVHCFFAEPTAAPCFLVASKDNSGKHPSVYDLGLDNCTEADGLAVPRASECAVQVMRPTISGVFTVNDDRLFHHLYSASITESLRIEPSAAAAFDGPQWLVGSPLGENYLREKGLLGKMSNATHILWTTGGLFVPQDEYEKFYARGKKLMLES